MLLVTADYYYPDWGALLIFLQYGVQESLAWPRIEPTTLDLSSPLGAFDHSAMAIPKTAFLMMNQMFQSIVI